MASRSILSLFSIAALCVTLVVASTPKPAGSKTKFNFNMDVASAINLLQENAATLASDQACCRSILNDAHYGLASGTGNAVVTIKLTNHEEHIIHGQTNYFTADCNNQKWGVWIFRCGQFINRGEMGWENWGMMGNCYHRFHDMHGVHFESEDCPSTEWRETQKCK